MRGEWFTSMGFPFGIMENGLELNRSIDGVALWIY